MATVVMQEGFENRMQAKQFCESYAHEKASQKENIVDYMGLNLSISHSLILTLNQSLNISILKSLSVSLIFFSLSRSGVYCARGFIDQ